MDIIVPGLTSAQLNSKDTATTVDAVGYLASNAEEFAKCLDTVFSLDGPSAEAMRVRAKENVAQRFSEAAFERGWCDGLAACIQ